MSFDGSVPGSIGKRGFYWKWYAEVADPPGPVVWVANTYHDYYTVLAAPQSPMSEPWTEVLDYSCDWASGQTSSSGCATEITEGIYYNLGDTDGDIDYDWPNGANQIVVVPEIEHSKYNLKIL